MIRSTNTMMNLLRGLLMCALFGAICPVLHAQSRPTAVIAYYSGNAARLDSFDLTKITHLIFCFAHLEGSRLKIDDAKDSALILKMVGLKTRYPQLRVLLSLGGWGGCETCSDAFFTRAGRKEFARSVKEVNDFFHTDGIDLDWEYPAIRLDNDIDTNPVHKNQPEDKANFTDLVKRLRKKLGRDHTISFAAGGFQTYLDGAVDWKAVMKKVDFVNMMTYDLVNGYARVTGHHTALYSTPIQKESTDNAISYLIKLGIDPGKIILGAAFYARIFGDVPAENNGLGQPAKFLRGTPYRKFITEFTEEKGYKLHWDEKAQAPYAYNAADKTFATFDDKRSIAIKSKYVIDHHLGGIMFWELGSDLYTGGLLETIYATVSGIAFVPEKRICIPKFTK